MTARFIAVEGEPGVGKTRLLEAAVDAIPTTSRVLRARGLELERERPFGAIADAFTVDARARDPLRAAVHRLLTGAADGSEQPLVSDFPMLRFRIAQAFVELVDVLTRERALTLVIEDLHWVDDPSVLVLEQIARRLVDRPLTIVATTRPTPRSSALVAMTRGSMDPGISRLELKPLSEQAVIELVSSRLGAAPGPQLAEVVRGAAGNPLYVTELLSALVADDVVHVRDGIAEVEVPRAPASLDLAILGGLGYLDAESLQTLRIASILGSRFAIDDLAVMLGVAASALLEALAEPLAVGLLEATDGGLVFRHDLVRDAIYRDHPDTARRALHLQAARRLADAGRPATQVATHYLQGAEPGDGPAISWLQHAAEEVLPRSPAIAADLLEGAVALCGPEHPQRDRLLVTLLIAFAWSGRNQEGAAVLEQLDARPQASALAATFQLAAGRTLALLGREREALPRYARAVDDPGLDERLRARAVADKAAAHLIVGELQLAELAAKEAIARGRRVGDDPALCGGLSILSWVMNVQGRTADALEHGEQAVRLARESPDRETARRYPHSVHGVVLMDADQLDEGYRLFDEGRRTAEELGDTFQAPTYHFGQMLADFFAGRLDDAEVALETALASAEEVGNRSLAVWAHTVAARMAIRRDELDVAARLLDVADEEVARVGPRLGADWLLWCRALLQEAEGDLESAATTLRFAWSMTQQLGLVSQGKMIGPDLIRLVLAVDDRELAVEVVDSLEATAALGGSNGARAVAIRGRGLLEADADRLLEAVALFRASPRRLDRADAMRDAGACLAAVRREDEARIILREALELTSSLGAVRDRREAEAALRGLGVVLGRRGARSRSTTGWGSLTATEREVATLASQGLSTPAIARQRFVSPRTIESHLSSVFGKLGVSSRVALAAEVIRRDG